MYPGVGNALQDRKRKRDDLLPASDQHLVPALHFVDSASTSFIPEDLHPKRQHLLVCSTASGLRLSWTQCSLGQTLHVGI